MNGKTAPPSPRSTGRQRIMRNLPTLLALLAIGAIYNILASHFELGPPGLVLGVLAGLLIVGAVAVHGQRYRLRRTIGLVVLGVITGAEAASTIVLVASLINRAELGVDVPHATAIILLRDATLLWMMNVLTFSIWYWELDGGGPGPRHRFPYHSKDFVFPQHALHEQPARPWRPHYVDYLFLAFNTSTAFSPTDTTVLSRRAKALMMMQALISLIVLAVIAARAINTL